MSMVETTDALTKAILDRDTATSLRLSTQLDAWCARPDDMALDRAEASRLHRSLRRLSAVLDGARDGLARVAQLQRAAGSTQVYGEGMERRSHMGAHPVPVARL
jgi:hypothetical protein